MSREVWRYISLGVVGFFAAAAFALRLWIDFERSDDDNMVRRFIRQMRIGNGGDPRKGE